MAAKPSGDETPTQLWLEEAPASGPPAPLNLTTNPTTITSAVTVSGIAVYGSAGTAWTVVNQSTITGGAVFGTAGIGISLASGGTVDNQITGGTTASIAGYYYGVAIGGAAGSVTNAGTIAASGSVSFGKGVLLADGGSVANGPGGATAAQISGYVNGIAVLAAAGTVSNYGTVQATGYGGLGVFLQQGGTVTNGATNATGATISGDTGIYVAGDAGTVVNFATIQGPGVGPGIDLEAGGSVTNGATNDIGATISGYQGIYVFSSAGTVTNFGSVEGLGTYGYGIDMRSGGVVTNGASGSEAGTISGGAGGIHIYGADGLVTNFGKIAGTATGGVGIDLAAGGTVIDAGIISGTAGAVVFGGTGTDLLILENGYNLVGGVQGSGTTGATNTLGLDGSLGTVTVNYNGLTLTNFQDVLFEPGGGETLKVSNTSGTVPVTISGFGTVGDVIDLTAIGTNGTITGQSSTQVTIAGSGGTVTLQLDGSDAANLVTVSDGVSGTDLQIACFCRGTLILTDRGEVAVEELAIGDRVVTVSGAAQPVKWIGRRAFDGRFIAGNRAVLPIRIMAGALAEGVPARDLFVSPGHALAIRGVLVQAEHLINGTTIAQAGNADKVEYFHIELEAHEIIFAEGAPAESYVECDNRPMFHNAGEFAALYLEDDRPGWQYCVPRLEWDSAELTAIRAALLDRAAGLGHALDGDPDLHLVVDGRVVRPEAASPCLYRFAVPSGSADLRLASRRTVPAEIVAASRDTRRLGVPVERIVLRDAALRVEIGHAHAGLREGFHDDEEGHRWTDGMARLPEELLRPFAGAITLEVQLIENGLRYPRKAPPPAAKPARARRKRAARRSGGAVAVGA